MNRFARDDYERVESDHTVMGRDEGPLIGRDADLAALLDAFNDGQSVVGVVGEPGLGKSRLIREFNVRATGLRSRGGDHTM